MTKRLVIVAVIAAVATAGIIFGVNALRYQYKKRYVWGGPEKRAEYIINKLTRKLDLTKDQQEKVNKIKDEILTRTKTIRNDRAALREELTSLIKSEKLTKDMVDKFIDKRKSKMDEIRPFFVEKFIEFHNILTPEQRAKLADKLERWYHLKK